MANLTTTTGKPLFIEKEGVAFLKFPANEVLTSEDDIKMRAANLERALKLGNLEHNKIKIIFQDTEGIKQVNTTIWGVTDKRIILKKGLVIPINRILEVI